MKRSLIVFTALISIVLLVIQPLLTGHMPWRGDGLLHFYRLAALENAITAGDWYPRWLPDLGYGYGFPLFNYYAPFSYYVALPFRWLGLSLKAATNASYILAMATLAFSAYTLGRDLWSRTAGLATAAALLTSPYILYNLHHRAALAELWGLATLTATLAAIQHARRLVRTLPVGAPPSHHPRERVPPKGRPNSTPNRSYIPIILAYTALMLSHNITALIGTPIILGFIIWPWLTHKVTSYKLQVTTPKDPIHNSQFTIHNSQFPLSPFLLISLSLFLSAFFWLPALLETDYVQIEQLYASANFAYENNFLTLGELFAFPTTADPQLINPPIPLMLGWGQLIILIAYGLLRLWSKVSRSKFQVPSQTPIHHSQFIIHHAPFFFLLVTIITVIMTLPLSQPLWQTLPLLEFVQFPWRFLGPAALGLALLCGYSVNEMANYQLPITNYQRSPFILHPSSFILFLFALPHLFPTPPPTLPPSVTRTELINFELETGWLGTTAAADYLPRTVTQLPPPAFEAPVLEAAGSMATFNQFAYPGWQAFADGRSIPITPTVPNGLIQVNAPADTQTITIRFGNTPLRQLANGLSIATALLLVIWPLATRRKPLSQNQPSATNQPIHNSQLTIQNSKFKILILIPLIIFGLKTFYLDSANTLFRRTALPPNTLNINFDNQLRLLNATLPTAPIPADEPLTAELYWQLAGQPQQELSIGLHLLSANGARYAQNDHMHPSNFPVTRWRPDEYARDVYQFELDPATPPGSYTLELFVYTILDGRRLNRLNEGGTPIGNTYPLGQITITPPSPPLLPSTITAANPFDPPLTLSSDLELLGYNLPVTTAELGDTIPLTLFWRTTNPPQSPPQLILLNDTRRDDPYQFPLSATAPNTQWAAGQIGRDEQFLTLPTLAADGTPLEDGSYFLAIFHNSQYQPLASLRLTAPPRTFTPPTPQIPLNTQLGNLVTLVGATLSTSIDQLPITNYQLPITLYYQPLTTTTTSYTAFVQLLTADGQLIAQSDHIPTHDGLTRPTTGWVPHEYITDTHTLQLPDDLPTATYTLITGLYNPATNQRLRTPTSDHIVITQLTINNEQ